MQFSTLQQLVDIVFASPPLPACTYNICLQDDGKSDHNVVVFPFLMNILVGGAKKLYGDKVNPQTISAAQFEMLKRYIRSLGYNVKHTFWHGVGDTVVNIWFERLKRSTDCQDRTIFE